MEGACGRVPNGDSIRTGLGLMDEPKGLFIFNLPRKVKIDCYYSRASLRFLLIEDRVKMEQLNDYLSDFAIADCLATLRAKQSLKRHRHETLAHYFVGLPQKSTCLSKALDENNPALYMPPRRLWSRLKLEERKVQNNQLSRTKGAIFRHVVWAIQNNKLDESTWGRNFKALAARIRKRVTRGDFNFKPLTSRRIKVSNKKDRFICVFTSLEDRIIIRLIALYLRKRFDKRFRSNCYSFREDPAYNHVRAVRDLKEYRQKYCETSSKSALWVSECDIRKFFDVIDHRVAWNAFEKMAREKKIASLVQKVVRSYIESYTSTHTLLARVENDEESRAACIRYVEKIKESLRSIRNQDTDSLDDVCAVGLPQGGTLSMILANCVMCAVDDAVMRGADSQLFYARYCDDSVIVHPNRAACEAAEKRYLEALRKQRLPYHPLQENIPYGKKFYQVKSKSVYRWDELDFPNEMNASPWVSFLGNQIRFDGEVRVRQETIQRHLDNLRKEQRLYIGLIYASVTEGSGIQIRGEQTLLNASHKVESLVKSMVAKGVGYLTPGRLPPLSTCWLGAFPNIQGKSCERQLRRLDAARARLLYPLQKMLHVNHYMGRPMSYCGFYQHVIRPMMVVDPFVIIKKETPQIPSLDYSDL